MSKTIVELEPNECRWPMHSEGKQHWFCGEPKAGTAYCAHHHAMAYREAKPAPVKTWFTQAAETKNGTPHAFRRTEERISVPDCIEAFAGRDGE